VISEQSVAPEEARLFNVSLLSHERKMRIINGICRAVRKDFILSWVLMSWFYCKHCG